MKTDVERQLRKLSITGDKIKVSFVEMVTSEPAEGEDESSVSAEEFMVKSKRKPHDNLTNSMTKLRKLALKSLGIIVDTKNLPEWDVNEIAISGDVVMHTSRVIITLSKKVEWSGGEHSIQTPQITMYGDSKFEDHEELAKIVEDVIAETWSYLNGAYYKKTGQIPLFPDRTVYPKMEKAA